MTPRKTPPTGRVKDGNGSSSPWALVIPPLQNKIRAYPTGLRGLWGEAELALQGAEELTVFGYSCPAVDHEAESLLRGSLHMNSVLTTLRIVDSDPAVAARFAPMVGGRSMEYFPSADDWLKTT